jgi:hypothetical protein
MFCLAGKGSAKAARMPRLRLTRRGKRARGQRAAEILTASRFTGRSIASRRFRHILAAIVADLGGFAPFK